MKVKNPRTKEVLKYLAIGSGVIVLSMISPQFPLKLIRAYIKNKAFQRKKFLEDLWNLQKRELADYELLDRDKIKITLKKKGKKKALIYNIDDMELDQHKRWDGKWRLIIFDFPKSIRSAREAFRKKLKELKFYKLQKSVYITPYPCEDEIDFICEFFKIRQYLLILTVTDFEGSEKLAHYFKLV